MKNILCCLAAMGLLSACTLVEKSTELPSDLDVRVTFDEPLNVNCIANGDFSKELENWSVMQGWENNIMFDATEGYQAPGCIKLVADNTHPVFVVNQIKANFKKGDELLIRFACKKKNTDIDGRAERVTAMAILGNGGRWSIPMPNILNEDHDWAQYETRAVCPDDVRSIAITAEYRNPEGMVYFDDFFVCAGKRELDLHAYCNKMQKVNVRNSVDGLIYTKNIADTNLEDKIEVPAFGSYCIEVIDSDNNKFSRLFPDNFDANVPVSQAVFPITPIKRLKLKPNIPADEFPIMLEKMPRTFQRAFLVFDARIFLGADASSDGGIGGHTVCLKVDVNGIQLNEKNMVTPKPEVIFSTGHTGSSYGTSGYSLYYCTTMCPLDVENRYCPVNYDNMDPFHFVLDITDLLKKGKNVVSLKNTYRTNAANNFDVCVENARIEYK